MNVGRQTCQFSFTKKCTPGDNFLGFYEFVNDSYETSVCYDKSNRDGVGFNLDIFIEKKNKQKNMTSVGI